MQITIELPGSGLVERRATVRIGRDEIDCVHLHLTSPEQRNRTDRYMRRHPSRQDGGPGATSSIDPNWPVRSELEPLKLPIPAHLAQMRRMGLLRPPTPDESGRFATEPTRLVVPISDLVANLLRPCFHRSGLGEHRVFFFEDEPIADRDYWCLAFSGQPDAGGRLELRRLRFDLGADGVVGAGPEGPVWTAALVPLVVAGRPLSAVEIAREDYDLRQILGRDAESQIQHAYAGWYDEWEGRVERAVAEHEAQGRPFATFYHSALALDRSGNIHIYQMEATLPDLAVMLAREGMIAAGLLDSGGSCALYDAALASYLNHGWYFREPRGAILVFELKSRQRLPLEMSDSWIHRRKEVESCMP